MKKMKKLASLFLAAAMTFSMAATAFADPVTTETPTGKDQGTFTITLENDQTGHTYGAYQIFKGDLLVTDVTEGETTSTTKRLSNIEWGDGVDTDKLSELYADLRGITEFADLADNATAADVAGVLEGTNGETALAREFADIVGKYLGTAKATSTEVKDGEATKGYTISPLVAGYYLVKDTTNNTSIGEGDAISQYILQVVANVTAEVKTDVPTIEKKILVVDGDQIKGVDTNTAGLGEKVAYELKSKVPDTTSYKDYYFVINDTLSNGLTFDPESVTVTVNGAEITSGEDYYLYTGNDAVDGNKRYTFRIAFANIMDSKFVAGQEIIVNYSATVNANAVVTGNDNTVNLTYSNDPYYEDDGTTEEPHPGIPDSKVPTGETPDDITITYLAMINIQKTDEDNDPMDGAGFTLTGTSNKVVLKGETYYVPDDNVPADETYYLLKDGTYTKDAPQEEVKDAEGNVTTESNEGLYANIAQKYRKVESTTKTTVSIPVKMYEVSKDGGKITFGGLGEGEYKIEETLVPAGYNKAPIKTVVLTCNNVDDLDELPDGYELVWNGKDGADGIEAALSAGIYNITIQNMLGALLPSTGGIGTTIFYAAGIILMAGAVFFVIRRRRA